MKGFISLGGGRGPTQPLFSSDRGSTTARCAWGIERKALSYVLEIPTRSKRVELLSDYKDPDLHALSLLDSVDAPNFRAKLKTLYMPEAWIINRDSEDLVTGIALVQSECLLIGLLDKGTNVSYLMWTDDPQEVVRLLESDPFRYLLFRYPDLNGDPLFLPLQALNSKWYRWMDTGGHLLAFNALERRLYG